MGDEGGEVAAVGVQWNLQIALAEIQLGEGGGAVKLGGQFLHCRQWVFIWDDRPINSSEDFLATTRFKIHGDVTKGEGNAA